MSKDLKAVANFLYEAGMLAKTPRSYFPFLGTGEQSVAEHLNRAAYIGYSLAHINGTANPERTALMCLFHDFGEARISDLNYVHQKYVKSDEMKVVKDQTEKLPFGEALRHLFAEYEERESIESLLAKDADNIEFIISIKEQVDVGNKRAKDWIPFAVDRLKTEEAKKLVDAILDTDSDAWWFDKKDGDWWVHRNKEN